MIGKLLDGRYEITKLLASGGFGKTYLAKDTKRPGNPTCVVKHLQPVVPTPVARPLFNKEAEMLEKLGKHDRIPQLFAYFEENNEFYILQEFIEGHPLAEELVPGKPLPEDEVVKLLVELLTVLEFVHDRGVIHRDIKPNNIIRRQEDSKLVLIDFGAVKEITTHSSTTVAIGTPGYMPSEQAVGKPKLSSDIYAVGAIAIQGLTGIPALQIPEEPKAKKDILRKAQVEPALVEILDKMMRPNYQERYPSAKQALEAIGNLKKPAVSGKYTKASFVLKAMPVILVVIVAVLAAIKIWQPSGSSPNDLSPNERLPLNGEVVQGSLTSEDRSEMNPFGDNIYSDFYIFEGRRGQEVTIEMVSREFDSRLILIAPDGSKLDENDDISPSNRNARIVATLPETGSYTLLARSSQAGESGNYRLWVESVGL